MAQDFSRLGPGHGLSPREIATRAAFDNAMILDMAMGGSTNTLPAFITAHGPTREARFPFFFNSGVSVFQPKVQGVTFGQTTCHQSDFSGDPPVYVAS